MYLRVRGGVGSQKSQSRGSRRRTETSAHGLMTVPGIRICSFFLSLCLCVTSFASLFIALSLSHVCACRLFFLLKQKSCWVAHRITRKRNTQTFQRHRNKRKNPRQNHSPELLLRPCWLLGVAQRYCDRAAAGPWLLPRPDPGKLFIDLAGLCWETLRSQESPKHPPTG